MEEKERDDKLTRAELVRWLIDRNDSLRSSYSNRALLVLTVDTFAIGVFVLLAERFDLHFRGLSILVWVVIFAAAVVATLSIYHAFRASVSFKRSRAAFPYRGKNRIYVHPTETFKELPEFEDFRKAFWTYGIEELVDRWLGELWILLNQQSGRYSHLRLAVRLMLAVLILSIVAFVLGALDSVTASNSACR